jgi:hypothetical protein
MEKQQPVRRVGRLRSLAVSGVVLGGLVAGGGAFTATAAHAATTAPRAAGCGTVGEFFPKGDVALMTEPSQRFQVLVYATVTATSPVAVGEAYAWDAFYGQDFYGPQVSTISNRFPTPISSFSVELESDLLTGHLTPKVFFSSCTWSADFIPA